MNRRRAVVIVGTLAAAQTAMHTIAAFFIAYIQLRLLRGPPRLPRKHLKLPYVQFDFSLDLFTDDQAEFLFR